MEPSFFLRGLAIGFAIAAPVGPIGILCIRRSLAEGRAAGFVSGLGAATADALYGVVAAFGLTLVSGFLIGQQVWLRLVGGVFLVYLGAKTYRARPADRPAAVAGRGLLAAYGSTLFLTLTNPMTIFAFAAIFAGVGLALTSGGYASAAALVAGVFFGSALWWLILSSAASALRAHMSTAVLQWVNRIAGAVITTFGLAVLASFLPR